MALLDFIKNRQANRQQSVTQNTQQTKPETAKQMYARQAEQEKGAQQTVSRLSEADKAETKELGARLDKATRHIREGAQVPPAPADSASSSQPMRQNMTGQEKAAPPLSPTSAQRGAVDNQQGQRESQSREQPQSAAKNNNNRPKIIERPRPSWERSR